MAKDIRLVRRAFNAGEISKLAKYRNDTEKHAYSCETLENFYVSPLGSISRREGTRLLGVLGDVNSSDKVRLVPFEYNRDLSYVLAFRSDVVENDNVYWETGSFSLSAPFSLCFTLPADYQSEEPFIKKGNLEVSQKVAAGSIQKVVIICADGQLKTYRNQVLSESEAFGFEDDGGPLIFSGSKHVGDIWGMKLFNFDISNSSLEQYYSVADYQVGNDELNKLKLPPIYSSSWNSYGVQVKHADGKITFLADFDAAAKEKLEEINQHYAQFADEIDALKAQIAQTEGDGGDASSQIEELKELYAEAYGHASWEDLLKASGYDSSDSLFSACKDESFSYPVTSISTTVQVSFLAPAGSRIELHNGLSESLVQVYFRDVDNSLFPAENDMTATAYIYLVEFNINLTGNSLSGPFVLYSSFASMLNGVSSEWHADKVVKLDVFGIDGSAKAKGLDTPIPTDILHEFQYKQVGGYVYVAHLSIAPKRLSIEGDGTFTWAEAANYHPSIDEPEEGLTLTFSSSANNDDMVAAGASGGISASSDFFSSDMVGAQLKIEYEDNSTQRYAWKYGTYGGGGLFGGSHNFPEEYFSAWIAPMGSVTLRPEGGIWDGLLLLEESIDGGKTWYEIGRTTSVQGSSNEQIEREVYNVNSIVRAHLKDQNDVKPDEGQVINAEKAGCRFSLYTKAKCCAWVEIVAVNGPCSATVKFKNYARANFTSTNVYKSAWGGSFGWPRAVEIHEERLTLAGTIRQPSTVWLSQTNNWDNFRSVSNLDTDPLAYTLASDDGEPISWLVSRSDLMIGLGSSEWSLGSRDAGQALTQSIVKASDQSNDGVEYIMPAKVGNMVFYVRRGNREIGSITYDFASDAYNSISLTTMNPEILGPGAVNIFNQLSPRNNVYVVRKDGIVAVFTYDKENNVAAWSRMTFGDGVVSACALSTGGFKSVFLAVKRGDFLCLERLDPNEMGTGNWLDCAPFDADMEIPEGLEVSVPYVSTLKTTPLFLEGHVKVFQARFYMLESWGGECRLVGLDENGDAKCDDWEKIRPRERELFKAPVPRDYIYTKDCDAGFLEEGALEVRTDAPAPFVLCAIGLNARGG